MTIAERIAEIEAAAQTPDGLTLRSVARMTEGQPDLARALDAAAVPHWWDSALLGRILDPDLAPQAAEWFERLRALSVVEPFLSRPGSFNVHEVTRQVLRARLHEQERLPVLSARVLQALGPVTAQAPPGELIERLHHQLVAEPEAGAEALEQLWRVWAANGRRAGLNDLAAALEEILPYLAPPARARALLRRANIRSVSRPASEIAAQAEESLRLFTALGDTRGMSQALTLQGDSLTALGRTFMAKVLHEQALTICRDSAVSDPANLQVHRGILVSLNKLAELAVATGCTSEARTGFAEGLLIARRLAALEPADVLSQHNLCVSLDFVASLDASSGRTKDARQGFNEELAIARHLAALDPANVLVQRDLSVCLNKIADLDAAAGLTEDARRCLVEGLEIRRRLAVQDPTDLQAQRDVWVSMSKIARLDTGTHVEDARLMFTEGLEIARCLAALDPTNVQAQDDLAVSCVGLASLPETAGTETLRLLTEAKEIWQKLVALDEHSTRYADCLRRVSDLVTEHSTGATGTSLK